MEFCATLGLSSCSVILHPWDNVVDMNCIYNLLEEYLLIMYREDFTGFHRASMNLSQPLRQTLFLNFQLASY